MAEKADATISPKAAEFLAGAIIAGRKPGPTSVDEIIVFDSTGTALKDVTAAEYVYRRALEQGVGTRFPFNA